MSRTKKVKNDREVFLRSARRGRQWRVVLSIIVFLTVSIITNNYIHPLGLGPTWKKYYGRIVEKSVAKGLVVDNVLVQGRQQTTGEDVLAALDDPRHKPMLLFSPRVAKERLESLPWIKEAMVKRQFPNTISIKLVERQPIALWQNKNNIQLIDASGTVITVDNWHHFQHLPLVVGDDAPTKANTIFAVLHTKPGLFQEVRGLSYIGERRWNVYMKSGAVILLPENHTENAWKMVHDLYDSPALAKEGIKSIDLRLPQKIFLRRSNPKQMDAAYTQQQT